MRRPILCQACVCVSLVFASGAAAEEQQDAAELARVLAEIQRVLPAGWEASFELVDPGHLTNGGTHPALEIKSCAPQLIEFLNVVNLGFGMESPKSEMIIPIRLVAYPYMSPELHVQARKENERLLQKRIDFETQHLQKISAGFMGVRPIPPNFYDPQSSDEAKLIMQYSLLWSSTEPRLLPTHHTDALAFDLRYISLDSMRILDAEQAKAYAQILSALEKIIVPYKPEP